MRCTSCRNQQEVHFFDSVQRILLREEDVPEKGQNVVHIGTVVAVEVCIHLNGIVIREQHIPQQRQNIIHVHVAVQIHVTPQVHNLRLTTVDTNAVLELMSQSIDVAVIIAVATLGASVSGEALFGTSTYWQHMVSKFPELQRGESASKTGLKHIPPQVFKQMVRLTKQSQRIEAALDSTNMFNAKSKAEEVKKLLARYIPAVEEMATQLKKYGVAFEEFEDLQAENEQLTKELDAAKRGSITEKLEQAKLQREYRDAKAILDRIPPEILNQLRKESRAVQRDTPEDLRH